MNGPSASEGPNRDRKRLRIGSSALSADQLLRGIGLTLLAFTFVLGAISSVRRAGLLAAPLLTLSGAFGLLATWAAVIHLTGGERFDDHPFV